MEVEICKDKLESGVKKFLIEGKALCSFLHNEEKKTGKGRDTHTGFVAWVFQVTYSKSTKISSNQFNGAFFFVVVVSSMLQFHNPSGKV